MIKRKNLIGILASEGFVTEISAPYTAANDIFLCRQNDAANEFQSVVYLARKRGYGSFSFHFGVRCVQVQSMYSKLIEIEYFQSALKDTRDKIWLHVPRLFSGGHILEWPRLMIPSPDSPNQWLEQWNLAKERLLRSKSYLVTNHENFALFYLVDELGCEWRGDVMDRLTEIIISLSYAGYSADEALGAVEKVRKYFDQKMQKNLTLENYVNQTLKCCQQIGF